jgi:tyrosine-protein kinase Etk/Wzc
MELPGAPHTATAELEPRRLNLFAVLARHWKMEAGVVLVACVCAALTSLMLPKEYDATASVLPPVDPRGSRGLEALIGPSGAGLSLAGMLQSTGTKDVFVGILKSRTMQDDAIKQFDLVKAFDLEGSKAPLRDARAKLEKMTAIRVSREGVISVTATAYDAQMAANIANFYMENLDRLNTSVNVTEAGRSRLFLEGRVTEAQKALRVAEDRLRVYQSGSKAVVMEGQAKAAIEGAAKLEGQILAAEVQLKTLETYSTPLNPDVIKLRQGIEEMRRQLRRMEYGRGEQPAAGSRQRAAGSRGETAGSGQSAGNSGQRAAENPEPRVPSPEPRERVEEVTGADFAMPLGAIPATGAEMARLIREAKIQETIYTLLTQQLEQAKIAEAKDTPTVRILDRAVPPEWKARPSVLRNTVLAGVLAIVFAAALAFVLDTVGTSRLHRAEAEVP